MIRANLSLLVFSVILVASIDVEKMGAIYLYNNGQAIVRIQDNNFILQHDRNGAEAYVLLRNK